MSKKSQVGLWRDETGTAQAETAFSIFMVLTAVLMLLEICSAVYTYTVLSDAANEGLRYAVVRSSDANLTSDTQTQVRTYAANSFHDLTHLSVNVSCPENGGTCPGSIPGRVQVTVSYPYVPYSNLIIALGNHAPTMSAFAEGRLVY